MAPVKSLYRKARPDELHGATVLTDDPPKVGRNGLRTEPKPGRAKPKAKAKKRA